jgi:hypothetical protein
MPTMSVSGFGGKADIAEPHSDVNIADIDADAEYVRSWVLSGHS